METHWKLEIEAAATIEIGDMRYLATLNTQTAAAMVSFFAIHHLDSDDVRAALFEWFRVLDYEGALSLAAWEGKGSINYGSSANIVALKYASDYLYEIVAEAGFSIENFFTEEIEEMEMTAVYLEAVKHP